jgi:hypothetical protein
VDQYDRFQVEMQAIVIVLFAILSVAVAFNTGEFSCEDVPAIGGIVALTSPRK